MPVTLIAPLLPFPLKAPVDVLVGEVLVDEPDPVVDVLLMVEPKPEVVVERGMRELHEVGED